ncbi:MAG TPA: class I SAM-dependent methyltransferase, partial [Vicinamibacteria bacterium]|nr:class I SAM-dependent methyltransferase [Vicinamibacteria bacterium]
LERIDHLSSNPAPYERDPLLPELLAALNQAAAAPVEEPRPEPGGLKGLAFRTARRLLAPELARLEGALARERELDSKLVQFLNRLSESANASGARAAEFASALVGFAQRIDRLADAKDRLYASIGTRRADLLLESMDKRVEAMRLGIRKAQERLEGMSTSLALARVELAARSEPAPRTAEALEAAHYVAFEERFRGSTEDIRGKLSDYVPYFRDAAPVVDLGCGRGEFLELLRDAGIESLGVDGNAEMVDRCLERGLSAQLGDVTEFVSRRPSASFGGIFAAQLVEHLPPRILGGFLESCHRALRPGGRLVLETVNPRSLVALVEAFYRDLTHEKPLHPDTLDFALRAAGFRDVELRYSSPVPERARLLPLTEAEVGGAASTINQNFDKVNAFLFGDQDYAAIAVK